MIQLETTTKGTIWVDVVDSKGHVITDYDGVIEYAIDTEGVVSAFPADDGQSCELSGVSQGQTVLTASLVVSPSLTLKVSDVLKVGATITNKTFGNTKIEAIEDASTFNHCRGSKFVCPQNGAIDRIYVYVVQVFDPVMDLGVAVYADNNGVPGALLAHFEATHTIGSGGANSWFWQAINCPVVAGKVYWLMAWSPNAAADMVYKEPGDTIGQSNFDTTAVWPTWSNPFVQGFALNREYSIYARLV